MKALPKSKVVAIELCYDAYSDLPDGAWWAVCEENGLYPEDFEEYWEEKKAIKL